MSSRGFIIFTILLSFCVVSRGQDTGKIDSLERQLSKAIEDTNSVRLMQALSEDLNTINPGKGLEWAGKAQRLAKKLHWERGEADALLTMASNYQSLSKFPEAEKHNLFAQTIYDRTNDKRGKAKVKNAMGKLYLSQGKYPEALKSSMEGLRIGEGLNDENLLAQACSNIGGIYFRQGRNKEALEYFNNALQLFEKQGNKRGKGLALSNIGAILLSNTKFDTALTVLKEALQVNESTGSMDVAGMNIANIAGIYMNQGRHNEALAYTSRSLRMNRKMNDMNNVGIDLLNMGAIYFELAADSVHPIKPDSLVPASKQAVLAKAVRYGEEAISVLTSVHGDINALSEAHKLLSNAHEKLGNDRSSLEHYKMYKALNDSIFSTDNRIEIGYETAKRADEEKEHQMKVNKLQKIKSRNETIAWIGGVIVLLLVVLFVLRERRRSEKLLLNILPLEVAKELKRNGSAGAKQFDGVTVIFTDFVNFTSLAERLSPQALVNELHTCFKAFDGIITRHKIEKIKTVGDAYLAVGGLPTADADHAYNVVMAAKEIVTFMKERHAGMGRDTFEIRVGIHSGSVVAGIVGVKKFAYDIWGDTVNTAARMEQASDAGKINISQATYELVKNDFSCTARGEHEVKNKGKMEMYFVE